MNKAVSILTGELARVLNYHRKEYDLCLAETIGVLEVLKFELIQEQYLGIEEEE